MDFSGLVGGLKKQGAEAFGNVLGRTGQINWASPSWDLFIFGFFVSAVILFMFSLSRERIFLTLLSTYITLAVVKGFDGFAQLFFAVVNIWFWQIIIFLIVLIIITALLSRLSISGGSGFVSLWQFFYFSLLQTGLLITIIISFFPKEAVLHFYPLTRTIFLNNVAQMVWFLLPLLSLAFIHKK